MVLSDKTLHILAQEKPTTSNDFRNIFGIGEHKAQAFGEQFISEIVKFIDNPVEDDDTFIGKVVANQRESHMECQKKLYSKAYASWTEEDDKLLTELHEQEKSIAELMQIFNRREGEIRSRLKKISATH